MSSADYLRQLKDPRWQKKRLEIFQRDNWACLQCGAVDRNLQVDHKVYAPSGRPWDVASADLETLCEECHEHMTILRREARGRVSRLSGEALVAMIKMLRDREDFRTEWAGREDKRPQLGDVLRDMGNVRDFMWSP